MRRQRSIDIPGFSHRAPIPGAAIVGNMLFSSAISGIDPETGAPASSPEEQVRLVFQHLRSLLKEAGLTLDDVGHLALHLRDHALRDIINEQWLAAFPDPHDRPARHIHIGHLAEPLHLQAEIIAVISTGE